MHQQETGTLICYEPGVTKKKRKQQTCNNNKFITEKLLKKIKTTNYVYEYLKSKYKCKIQMSSLILE
jgi:hypothetical protein